MKRYIATSENTYEEVSHEFVTKEETELHGIRDVHVQEYQGTFTVQLNGENGVDILNWTYGGDDLVDLVIPKYIYAYVLSNNVVLGVKKEVIRVGNNQSTNGWTSKNKIKTFKCEFPIYQSNVLRGSTSLISVDVKEVFNNTFYQCSNLVSAIIDGNIGDSVFYQCSNLVSVTLGDNVSTIGFQAFLQTTSLNHVNLNKVQSLGQSAFLSSGLTSIDFGTELTTIGVSALQSCNLTNITIPPTVTYINYRAFANNNFSEFYIPDTVITIISFNAPQGGIIQGNSVTDIVITTNAPSKPDGWGDYFNMRSSGQFYDVEYGV